MTIRTGRILELSISTRLILALALTLSAVSAITGYFNLRRREAALQMTMRNEVRSHAYTLQIALEDHYFAGREISAEQLINRLGGNPRLYRVTLFDQRGEPILTSNRNPATKVTHDPEVDRVIATGQAVEHFHRVNGEEYFSLIMPVQIGQGSRGAFEIIQPLTYVKSDIAGAQRDYFLSLLLSIVLILAVVIIVMRYGLARPVKSLLAGARAIGKGDLGYRVKLPSNQGELSELAAEFNQMAEHLAEQRDAAAREVEERLALERALRHSDRLSLLGRMAASIAHEMGTPLNVIDGRVAQLQEVTDASVEVTQRNLTIIRSQVRRITRFVRQILHLAHPEALHRGRVEIADLLSATQELLAAEARRAGIQFQFTPGEPVFVNADQDLLQQVLLNICLNGIQAMPDGGTLNLKYAGAELTRAGQIFVSVRIADIGPGIAREHLEQIFDPFFTTKDVGEGTGLGLAISRRIVEEHGGWVEVANQEGGGAVFTVYLPQVEPAPTNRQEPSDNRGE
jgi:signal transduction histidine kinase